MSRQKSTLNGVWVLPIARHMVGPSRAKADLRRAAPDSGSIVERGPGSESLVPDRLEDWQLQYDEAVQRRDWDTCDYLLSQREFWQGISGLKR